jgi:hypothetical protein
VLAVVLLLSAAQHAAELVEDEWAAAQPEPLLAEEDRTPRFEFHGDRHQSNDRRDDE